MKVKETARQVGYWAGFIIGTAVVAAAVNKVVGAVMGD